jgi:hypothetical protein
MLTLAAIGSLVSCSGINAAIEQAATKAGGTVPVVRAADGASASLTVTVCPRTAEGGEGVKALLDELINYQSEIVAARSGGSARLVLNLCPPEAWLAQMPAAWLTARVKR